MKFRRQYAIEKYVLDFYCPEYKIAIEADGGQHYDAQNAKKDEIRTNTINQYGIKVLRFTDTDILCNSDAVCEAIMKEIPSPRSSPLRGEEELLVNALRKSGGRYFAEDMLTNF